MFLQCVELLAQSNSPEAIEFCNLQSTYEMEGLLEAHDLIATETDRTPSTTVYVPLDGSETASNQNIANNNVLNVSCLTFHKMFGVNVKCIANVIILLL